jgi:hypothetical protein
MDIIVLEIYHNVFKKELGPENVLDQKKGKYYTFLIPIFLFLFLFISGVLFAYLYFYKPNIVTTKGDDNIDKIDWNKFVSFYIPMVISIAFVILIMYKIKLFYSFLN